MKRRYVEVTVKVMEVSENGFHYIEGDVKTIKIPLKGEKP